MRRCQIWDICSQLHVPLSPTDGNVTRPTFLSHLRSLVLPSSGYEKKNRKSYGRNVYSRLFIVIYWIFVIAGSFFRMHLWRCRFGNKEFSVQLQLLRPRLIGHWTFLCLSKGPLCRLKRYKLWPTERKNKAHWGRSNVPEWLLSCSLLSTGSRGGMKSRKQSSYIYKKEVYTTMYKLRGNSI